MENATDGIIGEDERKTVQEFSYLLEKSKQLFNGLRDLPQYGHKQWQSYFGRTFDIYTKLWKYQQQNRQVLDARYGLKRWQIGEIASKIGQLYYHYYLRTSETNYLNEAFSFYSAIRSRAYYNKVTKEKGPELMVKKLRYYARLIVVCLLLRKLDLVKELTKELSRQVDEYKSQYEAEDHMEWGLVLGEIEAFTEADDIITVIDSNSRPVILTYRLAEGGVPQLDKGTPIYLTLQEALIVGNCQQQVKFSELTLDMYRMLQTLEREPTSLDTNSTPPNDNSDKPIKRENPHKYLLYKPTFGQFYAFLSAGFKELPPNAALLLYLSADGSMPSGKGGDDGPYDVGDIATNSKKDGTEQQFSKRSNMLKEMHCIHPGDLHPFTRKPLFVVVDSANSHAFRTIPNLFGQPVVSLMSPVQLPVTLAEQTPHKGNLFTLFLHSPLVAFCYVCDIADVPLGLWENCQAMVNKVLAEVATLFNRSKTIDHAYKQFYGDEFLRLLILRFVFCFITLRYHRGFKGDNYYPQCHPDLHGSEILENGALHKYILDLASMLDVRSLFLEVGEAD
ncbi:protein SCAI-like isoform X2 [Amphiura filiformis]|uniref:protein SCAI-like isoform X2 n=1 Tax=Amphiura filiformis TaxID=82378 RepID=UPI003B216E23